MMGHPTPISTDIPLSLFPDPPRIPHACPTAPVPNPALVELPGPLLQLPSSVLAWYPCPLAVDFRLCLFPLLQTRPRLPRLQRGAEDERPVVSSGTHLGGKVC